MELANRNTGPSLGSILANVGGRYVRRSVRNYLSNNQDQIRSNIQNMARRGIRSARRFVRSRRTNNLRGRNATRNFTSGSGVTGQYDRTRQYRKKYMPRRKKRIWKRWIRRVNAINEKELGSRTYLVNNQIQCTLTDSTKHICLTLALYGSGSSSPWLNDLRNVHNLENSGDPTQAGGDMTFETTKYLFQSGILDITVRNTSGLKIQETPVEYTIAGKMEVDVYEMIVKRKMNELSGTQETLSAVFNNGFTNTLDLGGVAPGIEIDKRGATPWDATYALSRWGVRILKKTKYFLEPGGTFTYQMRDPKRHVTSKGVLNQIEGPNRVGWTKFVYIVGKLVPGFQIGSVLNTYKQELSVGCTRKYMYKIEGVTDDRDRYQSANFTAALPS